MYIYTVYTPNMLIPIAYEPTRAIFTNVAQDKEPPRDIAVWNLNLGSHQVGSLMARRTPSGCG